MIHLTIEDEHKLVETYVEKEELVSISSYFKLILANNHQSSLHIIVPNAEIVYSIVHGENPLPTWKYFVCLDYLDIPFDENKLYETHPPEEDAHVMGTMLRHNYQCMVWLWKNLSNNFVNDYVEHLNNCHKLFITNQNMVHKIDIISGKISESYSFDHKIQILPSSAGNKYIPILIERRIYIVDHENMTSIRYIKNIQSDRIILGYSPDNNYLYIADGSELSIYNKNIEYCCGLCITHHYYISIAFSTDCSKIIIVLDDGTINIYRMNNILRTNLKEIKHNFYLPDTKQAIYSLNDELLACSSQNKIYLYDTSTYIEYKHFKKQNIIDAISFTENNESIVSVYDGTFDITNILSGNTIQLVEYGLSPIVFPFLDNYIIARNNNEIMVIDASSGKVINQFIINGVDTFCYHCMDYFQIMKRYDNDRKN